MKEIQKSSMGNFFKQAFGIDWKKMPVNEGVDVSNKKIEVQSFDIEKSIVSFASVIKIIRKEDTKGYAVLVDNITTFTGAGNHKIYARMSMSLAPAYLELQDLAGRSPFYSLAIGTLSKEAPAKQNWVMTSVKKTDSVIPVLDMLVERHHNYFSNGILSHNTVYGNPETCPGGNALKFFSAIRLVTRSGDALEEDGVQIGMVSRVRSIKNKVAPPHRNCEMKILFDSGYQIEEEYVLAFQKYGIIKKAGGWFSVPVGDGALEKIQGAERVIEWLRAHPIVYDDFKAKLQIAMSRKTTSVDVESADENEDAVVAEQEALEKDAFAESDNSIEALAKLAGENG
jgi:hypothetical protein